MVSDTLQFGPVNLFDRAPQITGRYHVIDEGGFIRAKYQYGHTAYDHAGNLSDREQDVTFRAVDTRDGSIYGAYRNGNDIEDGTPTDSDRALLDATNTLFMEEDSRK